MDTGGDKVDPYSSNILKKTSSSISAALNKVSLENGRASDSNILLENKAIVLSGQECNYARMGNIMSLYATQWLHSHPCIRSSAEH